MHKAQPNRSLSALTAASGRIDLWAAFPAEIADPALLQQYNDLLPQDETQRMQRLVRAVDRHRFLITRALTRTVLSRYLSIEARDLTFAKNQYGRPYLSNSDMLAPTLTFNITHTHDLVLLGVTDQRTLGIDVESARRHAATIGIANRYFSPAECAALNNLPASQQQDRFFAYWTLKESYIKARGMGLSIPLDQFSFGLSGKGEIDLTVEDSLGDRASHWQFWQLALADEFLTAVCFSHEDQKIPGLAIRKIVPLVSEEPLAHSTIAASHGWPL
ncbi:MAG: 4'-phosphopantetheinyl transferase superfamily protein [Rhizobiaceae bacterium]|nr:4'-phosphopantetheinyl transferase superfamily protein [Rhizobiaceae bacterium]